MLFADWGLPTAECITTIRATAPQVPLIASGGLRHGLDIAKVIALGANIAGMALPFLQAASESEAALYELVEVLITEITTVLFCTGNSNLEQLQHSGALQQIQ